MVDFDFLLFSLLFQIEITLYTVCNVSLMKCDPSYDYIDIVHLRLIAVNKIFFSFVKLLPFFLFLRGGLYGQEDMVLFFFV